MAQPTLKLTKDFFKIKKQNMSKSMFTVLKM